MLNRRTARLILCLVLFTAWRAGAQDSALKGTPPRSDTSFIDDHGTAHVTRVVPVPDTISPEARVFTAKPMPDTEPPYDLAKDRAQASGWQQNGGEQIRKVYPVNVANDTIAGVPVKIVTPLTIPTEKQDRVLINLHGGGFTADWGSMIETIPVANLTQTKVVAVLYSLAPEHPFPAAVNEAVAVYKELLKPTSRRTSGSTARRRARFSPPRSPQRYASKVCRCLALWASFPAAETSITSPTRCTCTAFLASAVLSAAGRANAIPPTPEPPT